MGFRAGCCHNLRMRVACLLFLCAIFHNALPAAEVTSPDERVVIRVNVGGDRSDGSIGSYRIAWQGKELVSESRLGLELADVPSWSPMGIVAERRKNEENTWKPVCGERSAIRDHFNELVLVLRELAGARRSIELRVRAYDEGVAFCYAFPEQPGLTQITIKRELTEFRLSGDFPAWGTYTAQGIYTNVPTSQIHSGCERPLLLRAATDVHMAIAEARLVDYARMKFGPVKDHPHSLGAELSSPVTAKLPLVTPWRVVMLGSSPGQLLERNYLLLNLNDPCAVEDTSWIKPGKGIREVTLTTAGGKACVDFAVKRKLQYIEFDAGWYGPEGDDRSDARAVNVDPARSKGPLDLHEVIRYGAERGIGVILYVNRRALERQMHELFPLYRKWGVKGVKFGFVNVGSQQWTTWLHEAIELAAEHQLMVDVHDEYRPTGWSRTYPNLMTQEGVRGDEERQPNEQTLTTLFTRMLAGAADNTICYYDKRVSEQSSHAYQLAKSVCFFSPWQFLYWYDRPPASPEKVGGAGNAQTTIGDEPELEFFDALPTVWDETRVLHGAIGEYAVIARRKGLEWFVGAMNNREPRTLEVSFSFLGSDARYDAFIFSDDPTVSTRTRVKVEVRPVKAHGRWTMHLTARGGQALRLIPRAQQ